MNNGREQCDLLELIRGFNDTAAAFSEDQTFITMFEERAAASPDQIAVYDGDNEYSYDELNRRANQLAHSLLERDVGRGSIVGLLLERSFHMIVSVYAILKAGAAYLPLDPAYPDQRLRQIMEDSALSWIIVENSDVPLPSIPEGTGRLCLDDPACWSHSDHNPEVGLNPGDLAYVIYTSGSTGVPKGVLVEHGALVNRIEWMQKYFPITTEDILFQKTVYTFDVSVWELVWWSIAGAAVCLLPSRKENDPRIFVRLIEKKGISVIHFVPSVLRLFLEYIGTDTDLNRLRSLRYVFTSGEALSSALAEQFYAIFPADHPVALINLYGPTEATIDVSSYICKRGKSVQPVPIGRPIDNTRFYILHANHKLASVGETGDLYVAGVGLARGYLNNPKLTSQRFVLNPYEPGELMYRTGDLAYWNEDGEVVYMGREDDQVKLRGLRIELGEVETYLLRHPSVKDAVAGVRTDEEGNQFLTAYVVPRGQGGPVAAQELQADLARSLPLYAVPSQFIWLDAIPLKPNGKADKSRLQDMSMDMAHR
jgi:D-alanine--poly(phosphoribitol) ligase subunit 1